MGKQKRLPLTYYLLLLAAGAVYVVLALSDNIWADEAYSFAMLPHSFGEIWHITAADVQAVAQDLFAPEALTEVVWH